MENISNKNKRSYFFAKNALALSVALISGGLQAAENYSLEEVIVTANKRAENAQESSSIVTAIGGDDLTKTGVANVADLSTVEPGLQVGMGGPALQVYIRGVGNPGSSAVTNPAVAVNKGGVYVARSQAAAASFFDLERVEVLKGPQGTLYGRNATGGAINLIPKTPELNQTSGFVSFDVGNYNLLSTEDAVNLPLGDKAALRASINRVDRDGYMSDGTSDEDNKSGRLQIYWEPADKLTLLFAGQYSKFDGKGGGHSYAGAKDPWDSILSDGANAILLAGANAHGLIAPKAVLPPWITGPIVGTVPGAPGPTNPFGGQPLISLVNPKQPGDIYQDMKFYDASVTVDWDLDFATLTIIPAYQKAEMAYVTHPGLRYETVDPLTGDPERSEAYSLELRLAGDVDSLDWVTGTYFYKEKQDANVLINHGAVQNIAVLSEHDSHSVGVFGELKYAATDATRLIAGLRYSEDKTEKSNFRRYAIDESLDCNTLLPPGAPGAAQTFPTGAKACLLSAAPDQSVSFNSIDWKVGIEHDLSPNSLLFFTLSTGYKAGGLSQTAGASYKPENLKSYELGIKNTLLDSRLRLNAEVFYWDYTDHQEFVIGPDDLGIVGQSIINAGSASIKGASFDMSYATSQRGVLSLGAEYLDSQYDDFKYKQSAQFTPASTECKQTPTGNTINIGQGPAPELEIDCSGFQMVHAPKWTGSASYTHGFDLTGLGSLEASVDANYSDKRWTSTTFLPEDQADSYILVNARLTFTTLSEALSVTAYVKNITNEEHVQSTLNHSQVPELVGKAQGDPRMYGVRARYNF